MNDKDLIISRLRELFDADKSRSRTAEKLGVSRATIYYWLQGRTNSLDIDTLKKIAQVYGVNVQWIFGDSEKKYPDSHESSIIKNRIIEKLNCCSEDSLKKIEALVDVFLKG